MARQMTFGVIVGNRGFFPDHLAWLGDGRGGQQWPGLLHHAD